MPVPSTFTKASRANEHVSFRYPGDRQAVLEDISLTIGPGEIVAADMFSKQAAWLDDPKERLAGPEMRIAV